MRDIEPRAPEILDAGPQHDVRRRGRFAAFAVGLVDLHRAQERGDVLFEVRAQCDSPVLEPYARFEGGHGAPFEGECGAGGGEVWLDGAYVDGVGVCAGLG